MQRSVVVAVLTYRRSDGLRRSLDELRLHLDQVAGARLMVIDNDIDPSAAPIVDKLSARDPRVSYHHEPQPGIAAARNRALSEARADEVLVFIDDDEKPGPQWLARLVDAWESHHRPAAVVGPVLSLFSAELDPWISAGEFFTRLRHPTGTKVSTAATNNLLLNLEFIRQHRLRFDAAFGLSGGSDTVFSRTVVALGGEMIWCDEALVYDLVPADRATKEWVQARAARIGNSDQRANVHLAQPGLPRLAARLRGTGQGAARVVAGSARRSMGRIRLSTADEAKGTRMMLRGAGMLRGSWGSVVHEYRR